MNKRITIELSALLLVLAAASFYIGTHADNVGKAYLITWVFTASAMLLFFVLRGDPWNGPN